MIVSIYPWPRRAGALSDGADGFLLLTGRAVGLLGHVGPGEHLAPARQNAVEGPGPREAPADSPAQESNAGHVGAFLEPQIARQRPPSG